jgi:UDPglucose 6-dehydrogenase
LKLLRPYSPCITVSTLQQNGGRSARRADAAMRVAVIGAGFVGIATAVAFGATGLPVALVESDPRRRARLVDGSLPFHESGLDEAYRRLWAAGTIQVHAVLSADFLPDVVYVSVGTPPGEGGAADLGQVRQAAHQLGALVASLDRYVVVAVKSTVPPGTTRDVVYPILHEEAKGRPFGLVAAPEFLREGSALQDALHPTRIVIGAMDARAGAVMQRLHQDAECPVLVMAPEEAELVKYASNTFLAVKIAYANEMGNLAERLGLDIDQVMDAVGLDPRIGRDFLHAGLGFGGYCLPKDVAALRALARFHGIETRLLDASLEQNERQPLRAVEEAEAALGDLAGRRVALLGLAFKAGTSDVRESRAIIIHKALVAKGAEVVAYDPVAAGEYARAAPHPVSIAPSAYDALRGADVAIIQTAWPEFRDLDPQRIAAVMRHPVVVDGRRVLDAAVCQNAGLDHRAIGNGKGRYHESSDPSSRPRNEVPTRHEERPQGDVAAPRPAGDPIRR